VKNIIDANIRDYWNSLIRDLEENTWIQDIIPSKTNTSFSDSEISQKQEIRGREIFSKGAYGPVSD
jgi:hypothetical protein